MRTPIGVATSAAEGYAETYVVCDDGSCWQYVGRWEEWKELPPIPGTRRDSEYAAARRLK